MPRILEPEVMDSLEEAKAYDELDRLWGDVLFQGFAESALRMGVTEGRVLDVGCGPGRISVRLAKLNPRFQIEGIDLSMSMLALAERNAAEEGVSANTHFSIGDAKRIPFPDDTFDLVVCHNFLHQLADPLVAVKEIKRVAKKDGAILIRDVRRLASPILEPLLPLYCRGYDPVLRRLTYDSYRAGLTYRDFVRLVDDAGLHGASVRRYTLTHIGIERLAVPAMEFIGPIPVQGVPPMRRLLKSFYLSSPLPKKRAPGLPGSPSVSGSQF